MNWNKLEISLLAGGALIAVAGKEFGVPIATSIGVGIIALDIALVGLEGIITKNMKWGITQHYSETYRGIAAVALGLIMLTAGIGFGAMVIAQTLHQEQSLFELFFSRPGFALLLVGGIMLLRGLAGVIGAIEWDKNTLPRFGAMFERTASFFLFLLGLLLVVLGVLELIASNLFQQLISTGWKIFLQLLGIH